MYLPKMKKEIFISWLVLRGISGNYVARVDK